MFNLIENYIPKNYIKWQNIETTLFGRLALEPKYSFIAEKSMHEGTAEAILLAVPEQQQQQHQHYCIAQHTANFSLSKSRKCSFLYGV